MTNAHGTGRRNFLQLAGVGTGLVLLAGCEKEAAADQGTDRKGKDSASAGVAAAEGLMREHGVLRRVFVIYEEIVRRIDNDNETPPHTLSVAAATMRSFIEDFHQKVEEELVFPSLRQDGKIAPVLDVLITQHAVGRKLTDTIIRLAEPMPSDFTERSLLASSMRESMRMFRPHTAREETIMFPALHRILSAKEYEALGDAIAQREEKLFGPKNFDETVYKIGEVERNLGLLELATFTSGV